MKALVRTNIFIAFLKHFGENGRIEGLEIGDTLYKGEGWIDKTILNGNYSIEGVLDLKYEFNGLQCFIGEIENRKITLKPRENEILEFEIEASDTKLRNSKFEIIKLNAFEQNHFEFNYLKEYGIK